MNSQTEAPAKNRGHAEDRRTSVPDRPAEFSRSEPRNLSAGRLLQSRWLAASLMLLPLALVLTAVTPQYETNDDPGMSLIAAGRAITDHPDEHLVYSNVVIGLVLKQLYSWAPEFPWYGGYLFATAALALAAVAFLLSRRDRGWRNIVLGAAFLLLLGVPYLTQIQFTRAAFLATLAGVLLLFDSVRDGSPRSAAWFALPFLVIGSLIRLDAHHLALVVLSPVLVYLVWKARNDSRARRAVLLLAAVGAAGFGFAGFNTWYYERDPEWRGFYRFDNLRAEFIDYDRIEYNETTAPVFASVGWQPVDLTMLKWWCFLDRDRFNTETLQTIVDGTAAHALPPKPRPWTGLWNIVARDSELWALWIVGALLLLLLKPEPAFRLIPPACYAVATAVCVLLYFRLHLPARVYCPAFGACAIAVYYAAAGPRRFGLRWEWDRSAVGLSAVTAVIGAVLIWRGYFVDKFDGKFGRWHEQTVEMMELLDPQPDELYLAWGSCFPDQAAVPPLGASPVSGNFKMISLGWTTQTPFSKRRLESLGLSDLRSIVQAGSNVYFISLPEQNEVLAEYLQVHYGLRVRSTSRDFPALRPAGVYLIQAEDGLAQAGSSKF